MHLSVLLNHNFQHKEETGHFEVDFTSNSQCRTQNPNLEIHLWLWKSHSGRVMLVFAQWDPQWQRSTSLDMSGHYL